MLYTCVHCACGWPLADKLGAYTLVFGWAWASLTLHGNRWKILYIHVCLYFSFCWVLLDCVCAWPLADKLGTDRVKLVYCIVPHALAVPEVPATWWFATASLRLSQVWNKMIASSKPRLWWIYSWSKTSDGLMTWRNELCYFNTDSRDPPSAKCTFSHDKQTHDFRHTYSLESGFSTCKQP